MTKKYLPKKTIDEMIKDRLIRTSITRASHLLFFHFYFAHYVHYETAQFQKEIFALTENDDITNLYIVAFRGSGKSTIITTSYPIWAILGNQQKKFVLILSQTQNQARQHMVNLKRELESNALLKNDLGPFQEESDEWGVSSLVFSNMGARITVASSEQSIRGLRHGQYRPDLIIGDDVENMLSAKTKEGRTKTYDWLKGEVIPTGDKNTKLVIVGNLLHEDSLLMHLKRDIRTGVLDGVFREYPLVDKNNKILWPGKYPTIHAVQDEMKRLGNEKAWRREYLLEIISDDDQIITNSQINYYPFMPNERPTKVIIGVDLAISKKTHADYTAIVAIALYGYGKKLKAYILPRPINQRLNYLETLNTITVFYNSLEPLGSRIIYVENVGFQASVIEQLASDGLPVKSFNVTSDKYSRLASVSHLIISGKIQFPKTGAEDLITQLVGFGKERHDDLVDAFSIVAHKIIHHSKPRARVFKHNPLNDLYRKNRYPGSIFFR